MTAAGTLTNIGYDAHFQAGLTALGGDFVPGRIAVAHGDSYVAWTGEGQRNAVLVGNRLTEWRNAIDRPQVGDWVAGAYSEGGDSLQIRHLLPRRTCLVRRAGERETAQVIAANVDVVGIVSAFGTGTDSVDGRLANERRLQRSLEVVEQSGARAVLIVNKLDVSEDPVAVADALARTFPNTPAVLLSAAHGLGLEGLSPFLRPGHTLGLIGVSGVGKSTLTNALLGRSAQRVGEVRESDARGRHTTTHRELFLMSNGALLIDTPGMRELGVVDSELGVPSAKIVALSMKCRFSDCGHAREPGCAVQEALKNGALSQEEWTRFQTQKSAGQDGRGPLRASRRRR